MKSISSKQPNENIIEDIREKLWVVSEKVERHDVMLCQHSSEIVKLSDKIDIIIDKLSPLQEFAQRNDKAAKTIMTGMSIIGSIITIFCAFVGFKVWFH